MLKHYLRKAKKPVNQRICQFLFSKGNEIQSPDQFDIKGGQSDNQKKNHKQNLCL